MFEANLQDRKVRQFSLASSFLAEFEGRQPNWGPVGYFTFKRCVDVSTPVLCDDLQWRPAGGLSVGQGIVGFDVEPANTMFRYIRHGVVLHNKVEKAQTLGIELEDGTILYATPDHGWLVKLSETDNRLYWKETKDLVATAKGGAIRLLRPFGAPWCQDATYEGGFLAAAFDGEGCLDDTDGLTFTQVGNALLRQVEGFLDLRNVPFTKRQKVYTLLTTGRRNIYSLIGSVQPLRLINVFQAHLRGKGGGALCTSCEDEVCVVRVFDAGERDIAVLSTSTETHFTGGFASHNTYARPMCDCEDPRSCGHPSEEFFDTCKRVVEGVYYVQKLHCRRLSLPWNEPKAQQSAQEMFRRMWDFKWTPPGRGLWMMGTSFMLQKGGASINNCFAFETEILTADGTRRIGDVVGMTQRLLTRGGAWVDAPIRSFGKQKLCKLWLTRQGVDKVLYTTADHRWFACDRRNTYRDGGHVEFKTSELRPEVHRLQYVFGQSAAKGNVTPSPFGIAHGFAFGDGTTTADGKASNRVTLCGEKDTVLSAFFAMCPRREVEAGIEFTAIPNFFRERPSLRENTSYLLGWLMGYFAADGSVSNGQAVLSSADRTDIEFARDVCVVLGIGTYSIGEDNRTSNLTGRPHTMWRMSLIRDTLDESFFLIPAHRQSYVENSGLEIPSCHWTVKHVEETDRLEEVFCATVPEYGAFALDGNILTGNCAFVSSEHIDEDFAGPFTFLMDMSMLGVGVGGDTRGTGKVKIQTPKLGSETFVVEDSREGWVALARTTLNSFVGKGVFPAVIDFSKVRPKGRRIRGFGGTASGPGPLAKFVKNIARILAPEGVTVGFEEVHHPETGEVTWVQTFMTGEGKPYKITSGGITDVFNMVGACVVAGGVRRCIPKGTLIHTSSGLVPIEDVRVGSSVMTSQGYSTVTDWMNQGVQPISRVTTQMGVFEATDKHEIAVIADTRGNYEWKRLHELEPGDRMVFVDSALEGTSTSLPPFSYTAPLSSTTCKDISIPSLTPDVAWLMGLLAGDGYVRLTDNSGEISLAVAEDQAAIKDKATAVLSLFGVAVSVADPVDDNRCFKVRVKSKQLALYFSQFKEPKAPLVVPHFVLQGTSEIRAAYVAGLADADGSFRTRPMQVAASVYPDYLEQVQAVLASLGIPSRMVLHRTAVGTWQPLFHLKVVGDKAVQQFTRRVVPHILKFEDQRAASRSGNDYGFPSEMAFADGVTGWKEGRMAWSRYTRQVTVAKLEDITGRMVNLVPVEVLDIEPDVRTDATYDITVEAGEFVVQGGYLVHNSAEIMFGQPDDQEFRSLKDPGTLIPLDKKLGETQTNLLLATDPEVVAQMRAEVADLEARIDAHPLRSHRWTSNNSIFGEVGMDYSDVAKNIATNGEPGILWLKNAQDFGRMKDQANHKDRRAQGANPCFAGDTLIAVADGRGAVPIQQLVEEGNDVPVYSINSEGLVEIKMARRPRMTKEFSPLVEIELDDGTTFKVTPDHKMCLLDGTKCKAQDLQPGDSLPRLTKRQEVTKKGGKRYWQLETNTRDSHVPGSRVFEHRLIAQFHAPETWARLYNEAQQSGWVKGGLVVHHKDCNSLNNTPENLEIMTFQDHAALHGSVDNVGEKNPMWGKTHSNSTRQKIGRKTSERCSDPVFLAKLAASHQAAERAEASERLTERRRQEFLAYYKEQEARTDLNTVWMEGRLHAVKTCETCQDEFIVPWRVHGQCYCNRVCMNKAESHIQARKAGQAVAFADKQRQTLHDQVRVFKDLAAVSGTAPRRKDWEDQCRREGVPSRFRKAGTTENPHVLFGFGHLQQVAADYNHRVVAVRHLDVGEPVFNLSVEDNHTVGVVTKNEGSTFSCIFCANCVEQTLESFELCTLVETYPAHHDTYEDFQRTLKVAYLYAKTVTLIPTHEPRTNAVMNRNRRIGCSMSGIRQAIGKFGRREFLNWCDRGYQYIQRLDHIYSEWLGIPLSIKTTSVKPSGTVSLLCGATPGIHPPHSPFYVRNIRVSEYSPLLQAARDAGYKVEKDAYADATWVISFPVRTACDKGKRDVSIWEQVALAADMQRYWADNQVSCLTGDTLIRTSHGTMRMADLPKAFFGEDGGTGVRPYSGPVRVLNADNVWSPVSALIVNAPRPLRRVTCEGGQSLTGTPEHRLRVIDSGLNFAWRTLTEIQPGDYLVEVLNQRGYASAQQILQRRLETYVYPGRSDADEVLVPQRMSRDLAEFLGFMVSDGHVQLSTERGFGLTQRAAETGVIDRYTDLVDDLFGLDVRVPEDLRCDPEEPVLALRVNTTKGAHWLQWVGLYDDEGFKRVPWPILMAGEGAIKAFLRGVTLDGHFSRSNGRVYVMTTNSYRLGEELCVLLKQVGFQPLFLPSAEDGQEMTSPTNGKIYLGVPTWSVSLSAAQATRFMRMIGFAEDHKTDAWLEDGSKKRCHLFGGVPDFGLRVRMGAIARRCRSRFLTDHWHSAACHAGKEVSREMLFQMRDMGEVIPEHLLCDDVAFRRVLAVEDVPHQTTYDLTVTYGHSYVANGFASHNCTVTFTPEEAAEIGTVLEVFEDRLKSISFLPLGDDHGYVQAPYIEITEDEYNAMVAHIRPMVLDAAKSEESDMFCTTDTCVLKSELASQKQS